MRLDKYLKVSRLIKRRTVAKEVCDNGHISVNQRPAKAGTEVKPGDLIELSLGSKLLKVRVLNIAENARIQDAPNMYEVLEQ